MNINALEAQRVVEGLGSDIPVCHEVSRSNSSNSNKEIKKLGEKDLEHLSELLSLMKDGEVIFSREAVQKILGPGLIIKKVEKTYSSKAD